MEVILGFLYASLLEWVLHKYVLHGLGKRKNFPLFKFHWSSHHKTTRKNLGLDSAYIWPMEQDAWKEVGTLVVLCLAHSWLFLISPIFFLYLCIHSVAYFYIHSRCHLAAQFCRKYFPWHFSHHMGKNQDANWGVTNPIFDYIFRTRK